MSNKLPGGPVRKMNALASVRVQEEVKNNSLGSMEIINSQVSDVCGNDKCHYISGSNK